MEAKITKTYLGSSGTNYQTVTEDGETTITTTESATFHVDFPADFVNSTNRRFITVMPPKLLWGAKTTDDNVYIQPSLPITITKTSKVADNWYIMHCSFINRDPFHDQAVINVNDPKRKYKKYEYKGCEDGFDITFTDYFPAVDYGGWTIGTKYDSSSTGDGSFDYDDLVSYFEPLYPLYAETLATQVVELYTNGSLDDVPHYRNNKRFVRGSKDEYLTETSDIDWYDIVSYVVEQNNLSKPLVLRSENTQPLIDGDFMTYTIQTSYADYNINRNVSYIRYLKYKIFNDSRPLYYYAEFMVEY